MEKRKVQYGIYLNAAKKTAVRVTSPAWTPPEPEWTLLTEERNATLVEVRELARERGLVDDPEALRWGSPPARS